VRLVDEPPVALGLGEALQKMLDPRPGLPDPSPELLDQKMLVRELEVANLATIVATDGGYNFRLQLSNGDCNIDRVLAPAPRKVGGLQAAVVIMWS